MKFRSKESATNAGFHTVDDFFKKMPVPGRKKKKNGRGRKKKKKGGGGGGRPPSSPAAAAASSSGSSSSTTAAVSAAARANKRKGKGKGKREAGGAGRKETGDGRTNWTLPENRKKLSGAIDAWDNNDNGCREGSSLSDHARTYGKHTQQNINKHTNYCCFIVCTCTVT